MSTPFDAAFNEIVSGWMLVDDFDELTDRIEKLGDLVKRGGGLALCSDLQRATIHMMIQTQVAKGIRQGDFEDCGIPSDVDLEELFKVGRPIL